MKPKTQYYLFATLYFMGLLWALATLSMYVNGHIIPDSFRFTDTGQLKDNLLTFQLLMGLILWAQALALVFVFKNISKQIFDKFAVGEGVGLVKSATLIMLIAASVVVGLWFCML